jgi:hypothetical protein
MMSDLQIRILRDLTHFFFIPGSKTFFDNQHANGDSNRQSR